MTNHPIVPRDKWVSARLGLLTKEKEFLRLRDQLSRERRELPWERVEKSYIFEAPQGEITLGELFARRSQLIVYHFMFAPDWDTGCKSCSFWADSYNGVFPHLAQRDVSFAAVSRAPLKKLLAFETRMGWTFPWVSSANTDFNYDFEVSFKPEQVQRGAAVYNYAPYGKSMSDLPGFSVFHKDETGDIFHTYSTFGRGVEPMNAAYQLLDLVPKGRDEGGLPNPMSWVKLHDQYNAQ